MTASPTDKGDKQNKLNTNTIERHTTMHKNRSFTHIVDSTSGFVNAGLLEIVKLGLTEQISTASLISKNRVFLADGADRDLFLDALKNAGVITVNIEECPVANARIRKYPAYTPELAKSLADELNAAKAAKAASKAETAVAATEEEKAEEPAPATEEPAKVEEPKTEDPDTAAMAQQFNEAADATLAALDALEAEDNDEEAEQDEDLEDDDL